VIVVQPHFQVGPMPFGLTCTVAVAGQAPYSCFWSQNGNPIQDGGHYNNSSSLNVVVNNFGLGDAGLYQVVVSNAFGVVTSAVVQVVVHAVNVAGTDPVPPYSTWGTAATNIQNAITAAAASDIILVTNGIYSTGGKSMDGIITNRVSLDKAVLVQSVNGPTATVIQGALDAASTVGPGAIRCLWMTNNAVISGFTICGGATRNYTSPYNQSMVGGGVYGSSTSAMVYNCVVITNSASYWGGGAYSVTLNNCIVTGNTAVGTGSQFPSGPAPVGSGGGAELCILTNCFVTTNTATQCNGGGADNCNLQNCALVGNYAYNTGAGANAGSLVNCTVTANNCSGINNYAAAASGATLANSIVFSNFPVGPSHSQNYASCTMTYCCSDPLPGGTGNIDVIPQILPDGVHLAASSPCIGAGNASFISGTDIDGQTWSNPPAMGCDQWQPTPVICIQPSHQLNSQAHGLTLNVVVAGQPPFNYTWSLNGNLIQDNGHYSNSGAATLVVNNFGPEDTGFYQVVVSNAFGVVTSQVAQVVVHAVNAAGANPVAPFSTWATAAVNIQDAVEASSAGDIVLVTNGLYAAGGEVMAGDLTNRVAVDKAITVISVNGCTATLIQGAWDPISTNGPGAVRCAWVASGAVLSGFTLQNGATRTAGDPSTEGPLESGGGIYCASWAHSQVFNCVLSNNAAIYGGGILGGTLNNSLVVGNRASTEGGGVDGSVLNNCTVVNNYLPTQFAHVGSAGIYGGYVNNSIIVNNYDYPSLFSDNYSRVQPTSLNNSCTYPVYQGVGNTYANPQFLDLYHIATTSPCRGTGSATYASGTDLDGEPWNNPPSMGCSEVVLSNLVGSLSVNVYASPTDVFMGRPAGLSGVITGRASWASWNFGDGVTVSNTGTSATHAWTNSGNYPVTFTVYNNDNPGGVSTNIAIQVLPLYSPQLQPQGSWPGPSNFNSSAKRTRIIRFSTPQIWHSPDPGRRCRRLPIIWAAAFKSTIQL
jgi:hypothetical protein